MFPLLTFASIHLKKYIKPICAYKTLLTNSLEMERMPTFSREKGLANNSKLSNTNGTFSNRSHLCTNTLDFQRRNGGLVQQLVSVKTFNQHAHFL